MAQPSPRHHRRDPTESAEAIIPAALPQAPPGAGRTARAQAGRWFSFWSAAAPGSRPQAPGHPAPTPWQPEPGDQRPVVILDANMLCSRTCGDWLHRLAGAIGPRLRVITTYPIALETGRVLAARDKQRAAHPLSPAGHAAVVGCFVTVIEQPAVGDDDGFTGRDPGDRHIHQAAAATGARLIVSFNKPSDFAVAPTGYTVMSPDHFLTTCSRIDDAVFASACRAEIAAAGGEGKTTVITRLRAARLPRLARRVACWTDTV